MAKHEVTFTVPERPLGKSDIEFEVKFNSGILGRLFVSKGQVKWLPKNKSAKKRKLNWKDFDQMMREHGKE